MFTIPFSSSEQKDFFKFVCLFIGTIFFNSILGKYLHYQQQITELLIPLEDYFNLEIDQKGI